MSETTSSQLFTLAQNGPPPSAPGEGTPLTGGGANTTGGGVGGDGGGFSGFLLIIFVMLAAMLVISIFSQRRERKKREELLGAIKKHDRVQTIGGVIGSIIELKPDYVVLKVDESSNTRITFARSAIQQVIKSSDAPAEPQESSP